MTMVYLTKKTINGKVYTYLMKSIRLPGGKVKTIQKLVKHPNTPEASLEKQYHDYFIQKEKELHTDFAVGKYKTDSLFSKEEMEKIESIKVGYKYVTKKLTQNQIREAFNRFVANFTYESNAIEGCSLTLKDVNIVMFDNLTIQGKSLREIYETRNSRRVMDLILKKKFRVCHEDILRMHRILVKDTDTEIGYKKVPNFLVGKRVKTTPPEKVYAEMTKLIDFCNSSRDMHPLMLSALAHGKFEQIHPFEDGNGRVGRFLVNVILVNNGYPPLIIRKTTRESYLHALEDYDGGYAGTLKRFFLEKYKETFRKFFQVYVKYL